MFSPGSAIPSTCLALLSLAAIADSAKAPTDGADAKSAAEFDAAKSNQPKSVVGMNTCEVFFRAFQRPVLQRELDRTRASIPDICCLRLRRTHLRLRTKSIMPRFKVLG